jgi:hypothetical protein
MIMAEIIHLRPVTQPATHQPADAPGPPSGGKASRSVELLGVVAMIAVAVVHLLGLRARFQAAPYVGVASVLVITGAVGGAVLLAKRDERGWMVGGALSLAAILAFITSRTVGLPGVNEVGRWGTSRDILTLVAEGVTVALATRQLRWVWLL